MPDVVRIAIVGDFNPDVIAHQANPKALTLSASTVGRSVEGVWCDTPGLLNCSERELGSFDAYWCVPCTPYRSNDGAMRAIRYAREHNRPFLGTCGGFQYALLEFARNVLKMSEAQHAEDDPAARVALLTPLTCPLVEKTGTIHFTPGSRIAEIYRADSTIEGYHCSFGLNEDFAAALESAGMRITARDPDGSARAIELSAHPFFMATLFQPERNALQGRENPLITAFVRQAAAT